MSRSTTIVLILTALGLFAFLFIDQPVVLWVHENIRDEDKGIIWLLGRPGRAENWALVALGFLLAPRVSLAMWRRASDTVRKGPTIATHLFIALLSASALNELLKIAIGRPRPTKALELASFSLSPLNLESAFHSFPSGHTQTAWTAVLVLGSYFPRLRLPLFVLAACAMVSRVLMNRHYVSDTLIGCVVAIVVAGWSPLLLDKVTRRGWWTRANARLTSSAPPA
jgi:membrane-associated phospholipid phosphatase